MVNARQRAAAKRKRDEELLVQEEGEDRSLTLHKETPVVRCAPRVKDNSEVSKSIGSSRLSKDDREFEVFIGGLTNSATESSLRKDFDECGRIVYCRVPLNDEGNPRGFAFIRFADREAFEKALSFDGSTYSGRNIQVRASSSNFKRVEQEKASIVEIVTNKCNSELEVFLHGIPSSTTEESLRRMFADCGEIVTVTLPMSRDGAAKGIAFIEFRDKSSCDRALKRNDTHRGGHRLNVRMSAYNGFEARAKRRAGR